MSENDSSSNQHQDSNSVQPSSDAAKNIQGLADLLANMLTTEGEAEKGVSVSWQTSSKSNPQALPKQISPEAMMEEESELETDVVVTPHQNTDHINYSEITLRKFPQNQPYTSAKTIPIIPKSPAKFNAQSKFLEAEIEDLRNILVGLESKTYNNQELINLLLPAVTETIRDTIQKRQGAIANILKPGEGKTITEQIESETEIIMDALYPVIGATIGNYIATTIRAINHKVANALDNVETTKNNLQVQIISPSKLQEKETTYFKAEAVFLIHKKSHLIVAEKKASWQANLTPELISRMLTNIRNLSYKFNQNSDHNFVIMADGDNNINIYSGQISYLAVIAQGNAPKSFLQLLADQVNLIEKEYESCLKLFQGDRTTIPESLEENLNKLLEFEVNSEIKKRNKLLINGSLLALFLIGIPTGIYQYFQYQNQVAENKLLAELTSQPELSLYNLGVDINRDKVDLSGKLPNNNLKQKAGDIVQNTLPNLTLDNQIEVVNLPANKTEIEQILQAFNQIEGINIDAVYQEGMLRLTGEVVAITDLDKIAQSFANIQGVNQVDNQIKVQPLQVATRIYFGRNSTQVAARDIQSKLIPIRDKMQQYPQLKLKIIGYKSSQEKQGLGLQRSQSIENILEDLGIDRRRLAVIDGQGSPPDVNSNQESWLNQCVIFEAQES